MDSPLLAKSITQKEFNDFHSYDRALFSRLVITLGRDIRQSYQVMSFLLYLELTAHHLSTLISNLASSQDAVVNMVADQVVTCMICLYYEDFTAFVANLRRCLLSPEIPYITGLTRGRLNLIVIHNNRENILFEMRLHMTRVCIPAFQDIRVRAEMYNSEIEARTMAIARRSQMGIRSVNFQKGGRHQRVTNGGQGNADDRTIFLTFSRGYPVSRAEVHAYFTWRFGDIIEAIHMGGAGWTGQALYAMMVINSPAMIPEILIEGMPRTKYCINGKHVWAREFIPSHRSSSNNDPFPHSYGNFF